ncbi:MAG TPA: peptidylprolyl isomerase [Opitutaceae bacterium]|nr:peptidylprolyl isomerase [Opitutaceae bacterium]
MMPNVVTFHFTLRDPQGRVLDTSRGGAPVAYLEGAGQIIDGLDEQLRGEPAGVRKQVRVPAARAYGPRDDSLVQKIPRQRLPVTGELRVGDQFRAGDDRAAPVVTVVAIDGDEILLDANHPLAGLDLAFEVEIIAVRPATPEERRHGHAHGPGGCEV